MARSVADDDRDEDDWNAFVRLGGVVALRSCVYFGLQAFIPLWFIHQLGTGEGAGNAALTAMLVAGAVGTYAGGRVVDRVGRRRLVVGSTALTIPVLVALVLAPTPLTAAVLTALAGFLIILTFSITVVMSQEYLPSRLGLASGVSLGLAIGFGGIAAAGLGVIADAYGLPTVMWLIVAFAVPMVVLARTLPVTHAERRAQGAASQAAASQAAADGRAAARPMRPRSRGSRRTSVPPPRPARQRRVLPARVGRVEVRARRDDLVDAVEHVVGRASTSAAPSWRLELLHRARADDRRGDRRVVDARRRAPGGSATARPRRRAAPSASAASSLRWLLGQRQVVALRDALGARATRAGPGPCGSGPAASRRRAGSTGSRPCRSAAHVGSTSASIAAHEHRVRRLLADEALAAAPLGDPLRLDDLRAPGTSRSRCSGPCPGATRSVSAPSVSSMSVSGSGRWIW